MDQIGLRSLGQGIALIQTENSEKEPIIVYVKKSIVEETKLRTPPDESSADNKIAKTEYPVALIVRNMVRRKRAGKCSGCDGCDSAASCDYDS